MNKLVKLITAIDMYDQKRTFIVSKDMQTFKTKPGALCSLMVYTLTFVYFLVRLNVLITNGESNVSSVTVPADISDTEVFKVKVGDTESGSDFRLAVNVEEFKNPFSTIESLKEVGTVTVKQR
jgi:hypothetical protein